MPGRSGGNLKLRKLMNCWGQKAKLKGRQSSQKDLYNENYKALRKKLKKTLGNNKTFHVQESAELIP
jgi:hypothetical protein